MKKLLLLLTLFSTVYGSDILFLLHDHGELKAFKNVLPQIKSSYSVIQLKDRARNQLLSEDDLARICSEYNPKLIVSGVSYRYMGQILDRFEGVQKICFWDNFSPEGLSDYFSTGHEVIQHADVVFVPGSQFDNHPAFEGKELVVINHPVFDLWHNRDGKKVRDYFKLDRSKLSILFLGGYGSAFNQALESFKEAIGAYPDVKFFVASHPKLGLPMPFETPELVKGFDLIVAHQSTAGILAAMSGKRVIFYTPDEPDFTNSVIENGTAKKAISHVGITWILDDLESWDVEKKKVEGGRAEQLAWMLDRMVL